MPAWLATIIGVASFGAVAWQWARPPRGLRERDRDLYDWLVRSTLIGMGVLGAMVFYVLWSIGALAVLGLSGYAKAGDLSDLTQQIQRSEVASVARDGGTRALLLEMTLSQLRERQCAAQNNDPPQLAVAREIDRLIQEKRGQYFGLTGRSYDVGMCF